MSREQQIQELTSALSSLTFGGVVLSDAINSDLSINGGVAATPKAVKTAYDKAVETQNTIKNLSLTGDVTGTVSFNGSTNASITTTVADDSHNHVISNIDNLQTTLNDLQTTLNLKADKSNPSLSYPLSNGYTAEFRRSGGEDNYAISIVVDDKDGNRKFYTLYNSTNNTFLPLEKVNFTNGSQLWIA